MLQRYIVPVVLLLFDITSFSIAITYFHPETNTHMQYNRLRLCRGGMSESSVSCCGSQKYIFMVQIQSEKTKMTTRHCISSGVLFSPFPITYESRYIIYSVCYLFVFPRKGRRRVKLLSLRPKNKSLSSSVTSWHRPPPLLPS